MHVGGPAYARSGDLCSGSLLSLLLMSALNALRGFCFVRRRVDVDVDGSRL